MSTNTAFAILRQEEHISASALSTYIRCPQQWEYRYVEKADPEHRSSALVFGSGVHRCLARYYASLRDGQPTPTTEEMQAHFADNWKEELAATELPPVVFTERESPDQLLDLGNKLIATFAAKAELPHRVVDVESSYLVPLHDPTTGETLVERLMVIFDLVVQRPDGTHVIIDHKTAARKPSSTGSLQVSAYSYAAPSVGLGNAAVQLQVLTKTKTPDLAVYDCTVTGADHIDFLRTAVGVLSAVRAGVFYPVRDWHCSSCAHKARCLAG